MKMILSTLWKDQINSQPWHTWKETLANIYPGKIGNKSLKHYGVFIWNSILDIGIKPDISVYKFPKTLSMSSSRDYYELFIIFTRL